MPQIFKIGSFCVLDLQQSGVIENKRVHPVSDIVIEEDARVFLSLDDPDHSEEEDRSFIVKQSKHLFPIGTFYS